MFKALKVGMGFGLSSATITTLGLIIGLETSTGSRLAVIGGILTIAIADSCSDALGVHIAKESEGNFTTKEIWQATIVTFLCKAFFACTFLVPILLITGIWSIYSALIWGAFILLVQNYYLAKDQHEKPLKVISEHLLIAVLVMVLTGYIGQWIGQTFR
jgi:VIT1/CCC1 family predicted Fe2+/Mn2+ transporter